LKQSTNAATASNWLKQGQCPCTPDCPRLARAGVAFCVWGCSEDRRRQYSASGSLVYDSFDGACMKIETNGTGKPVPFVDDGCCIEKQYAAVKLEGGIYAAPVYKKRSASVMNDDQAA